MEQPPFYRTDLDERKVTVTFSEIHPILRDIVYYFEINLNERMNILFLRELFQLEYWKYLSISSLPPVSPETKRYAWLCERGCLALLNGMSLDFLAEQQVAGSKDWHQAKAKARQILTYLEPYRPSSERLEEGRGFLVSAFSFIAGVSSDDLDESGEPNFPIREQAHWFTKNIVGDYFTSTAKLDFG